jgi:hypothetical protein
MDELIKMVTSKTGMSDEMARQAVDTVIGYLKDKLPGPIGGQIDGLLGGASKSNDLGGLAKGLGGLLGKK